ncbi:hypothetical protein D9M68_471880 [compost metagenome]
MYGINLIDVITENFHRVNTCVTRHHHHFWRFISKKDGSHQRPEERKKESIKYNGEKCSYNIRNSELFNGFRKR